MGRRQGRGQSGARNCCLTLGAPPLVLTPRKGEELGCFLAVLSGGEVGDWDSWLALVTLYLHPRGLGTSGLWAVGWGSGRSLSRCRLVSSPFGAGPGAASPARCEARTSGIPREDSEVLSGVGFMASAWICLLPVRKCREVLASGVLVFCGIPGFPNLGCPEFDRPGELIGTGDLKGGSRAFVSGRGSLSLALTGLSLCLGVRSVSVEFRSRSLPCIISLPDQ